MTRPKNAELRDNLQKLFKDIKAKTRRETIRMCWRDVDVKFNSRPKEIDEAIQITESSRDDLKKKWKIKE